MTYPGTDKDREISSLKAQLKKEQQKNRQAEFKEFINKLHSEGRIVSDLQNIAIDLMEAMHEAGEINFSDGKANALEKFKNYLQKQPKMVEFGEIAKTENVNCSSASEQLNILAMEKTKKHNISFSEALSIIQAENPDLAQKAAMEI